MNFREAKYLNHRLSLRNINIRFGHTADLQSVAVRKLSLRDPPQPTGTSPALISASAFKCFG